MKWNLMRLNKLLRNVKYKNHQFRVVSKPGLDGFLLQSRFSAPCQFQKSETMQAGRKWYLSPYMTRSEVIQTAFKAVLTAEEHEVRESFLFKGQAIFGPHIDVEWWAKAMNKKLIPQDSRHAPRKSKK